MNDQMDDFTVWRIRKDHLKEPFPYVFPDLPPRFRRLRALSRGVFLMQLGSSVVAIAGLLLSGIFFFGRETEPPAFLEATVFCSIFLAFLFTLLRFLPGIFWRCPCCKTKFPYYVPARYSDALRGKACISALEVQRIFFFKPRCCPLIFPSVCPVCKRKFFQKTDP